MEGLDKSNAKSDPFEQFAQWYAEADKAFGDIGKLVPSLFKYLKKFQVATHALGEMASAMTLATVSPAGQPSARTVLLKHFDRDGFVFYTNYESRKAEDLAANPRAALVAWWQPLGYQVRMEGQAARISEAESDAYFASRPRDSQLSAWASDQSRGVATRDLLDDRLAETADRFEGQPVPRPPFWGGYRLTPHTFEFWQCRPGRLHDRLRYRLSPSNTWTLDRLMP